MAEKSLKKNTIYNAMKTCSSIIFPLITFPYISRILFPENVGKVNFGNSFVGYFSLIASLGITTYAIRECSCVRNDRQKLSRTASEIFSINIWTTIIAYILLACSLLFFRKLDLYRLLIVIQSTSILFTTLGADWLNAAMEDYAFITARTIGFQLVALIGMFAFVRCPDDYMKYAAISVLSNSGANVVNIWYRRRYCKVTFLKNIDWKTHIAPIMLLFVMILSQQIFNNADITMLGFMKGDYEVGLYSTAVKITNLISQLVFSVLWVIMPRLSNYFAVKDYEKINVLLRKVLSLFVIIGFPCIIGMYLLSEEIIYIVAGIKYIEASTTLKILALSFAFNLFGGGFIGNIILLPSKREKEFMIVCCIMAGVNVITNYFLIPVYGANAAAFTTLISTLLMLILLIPCMDKQIKIEGIRDIFLAPIVGSVLIVICCLMLKNAIENMLIRMVWCLFICAVGYLAVLLLMRNTVVLELAILLLRKVKKQ